MAGMSLVGVAEVEVGDGFGGGVAGFAGSGGWLPRTLPRSRRCLAPAGCGPGLQDDDAQGADAVALLGVQGGVGRQGEGGGGLLAVPGDPLFLQGGGSGKVSVVVLGQVDAVSHDQAVLVFPAGDGGVVRRAVVGRDFGDQPGPFGLAALVIVEHSQALHGGDDGPPPAVAAGGAAGVQQVGFLQGEVFDDGPVAFDELVVVVVAQFTDGFDPGAEGGDTGRAAGLAVVVPGEQLAEEPRQGRVDAVPRAAQVGQQAGVSGSVQQAGQVLLRLALQFGQGVVGDLCPSSRAHRHPPCPGTGAAGR